MAGAGLTWLDDDTIAGGRDIMHFDTRVAGSTPSELVGILDALPARRATFQLLPGSKAGS